MKSIRIAVVTALALAAILGAPQVHHAAQQHHSVRDLAAGPNVELCC
jgi:hypothetical protein